MQPEEKTEISLQGDSYSKLKVIKVYSIELFLVNKIKLTVN